MTVLKIVQKCIRRNSGSKCSYRTASWKSVRESYHQKWPYWNAAQNVSAKTVVQNVLTELLAEKSVRESYHQKLQFWKAARNCIRKNSGWKCLYRNTSWQIVPKNYHWKWPHWNAAQKVTRKNSCSKCRYKSMWRSVRKTITENDVLKCCPKNIRKISCSNCPFRNASWKSSEKNYHLKWP